MYKLGGVPKTETTSLLAFFGKLFTIEYSSNFESNLFDRRRQIFAVNNNPHSRLLKLI